MSKTFAAAMAACALSAAFASAQDPAPTPAPAAPRPAARPAGEARSPRIAVIDMQVISTQSQLGKTYAGKIEGLENQIKAEGTKKQGELAKMDAAIKALQEELEKQATVLSAEAADKRRQEITRKGRERQAFLEDGQQELQRMKDRAEQDAMAFNNEFQSRIKPHIEAIAKERGVDILLTSQVALTMNRDFDISQEVVQRTDAMEKAPAARPAAAPPAAPRPTPSPLASPRP